METTKATAISTEGTVYEIDTVKKTCKRIFKDLAALNMDDVDVAEMSMTTYQRYLKDKFPGEGATIKKGKLHFRGYRISCTKENGFMIEDSTKRYAVIENAFSEGIPTPKELGDFFKKPVVNHTPEELAKAVELGKKKSDEHVSSVEIEEPAEIDFEVLRRKVLGQVRGVQDGKVAEFDPLMIPDMIPFKKWKRKINAVLKDWKSKKIRYQKLLTLVENITMEQSFETEDTSHRNSFVGTILPVFKKVHELKGNEICVDCKWIPAVPFMQAYLLHYEPKAMPQLMRFANGDISEHELLENPYHKDNSIEYNSKLLKNTERNAQILDMLFMSVGLVSPQDLVYSGLEVGDKITIFRNGKWEKDVVTDIECGVLLSKEIGLLKTDKWIKSEK